MGYTDYATAYNGVTSGYITTAGTSAFTTISYDYGTHPLTLASGNCSNDEDEDDRSENEKWLDNRVEEISVKL